ncbi:MAG: ribose-phosphate diphosphokinase [Moraxellaceae bacterium]|jgi:ribose-phosphate pyrophosphokinase|nr:ribose-phosphate diphosphokinase [Moraxellaceae bacterium]
MTTSIIGLLDSDELATTLANSTGWHKIPLNLHRFPDGEWRIRLLDKPQKNVALVCSLDHPNDKIVALILVCGLLRDMGVEHITLVTPYLAYMRQDVAFNPGEGVSARYFANLLSAHVDRLVTIDPHLHRIAELEEVYTIPCVTLHAAPLLGAWVRDHLPNVALIGPDGESEQWVSEVAGIASAPYVIMEKKRFGDQDVRIEVPDLSAWKGRTILLVDDMISTGRTLIVVAEQLRAQGFTDIRALCVHALHDDDAAARMKEAGISAVLSCNTVVHPSNAVDIADFLLQGMT